MCLRINLYLFLVENHFYLLFSGGKLVQKFEDENLLEKVAAEMEFCKIDP
jgi:hypothetical protein